GLLRAYRVAAGLTQEALAERAGLGTRTIQGLERGEGQPRRATAERLARELGLGDHERAGLAAAARPAPRAPRTAGAPPTPGARPGGAARLGAAAAAPAPDVPSPRSLDAAPDDLPAQLSSFVGRDREMAEVKALVARARLVTLTGAGGAGKTRLALQVAADVR